MNMMKNAEGISADIERGLETGIKKGKEVLANIASHLPFANLAKKDAYNFSVEIDLPGVKKDDIDINLDGNRLNISAVRKTSNEVREDDYYIHESFYGKIARSFILPDDIDTQNIDAKLEDGRLYLNLKKSAASKPRSISIR